ncbi:ribulose-5-phosphate 4-epimerase/fuculose-1-phosphate aldolase [Mycobacteroides chelonae]|nr:ribulose-5-phosphate 4-epimerase/fuculose-1-phosphate aldolase [Mycobacteroides chelonae]
MAADLPAVPTFGSCSEERLHRKQRLAAGFRVLGKLGLTTGMTGHITVRDPGDAHSFWVNPLGVPFSQMRVSDLVLVNQGGDIVQGEGPVNAAAFAIHSRIHLANPHLNAACHSHAPWGRAWSATQRLIEPTSQDACAFFRSQAMVTGFEGVVLDLEIGDAIGAAFQTETGSASGVTVAVHENHGHIAAGETVDETVFWFVLYEQMCQSQMRLEATGRPYLVIDDEIAMHTNRQTGTRYAGWLGFQVLYAQIVGEQPDLLN